MKVPPWLVVAQMTQTKHTLTHTRNVASVFTNWIVTDRLADWRWLFISSFVYVFLFSFLLAHTIVLFRLVGADMAANIGQVDGKTS